MGLTSPTAGMPGRGEPGRLVPGSTELPSRASHFALGDVLVGWFRAYPSTPQLLHLGPDGSLIDEHAIPDLVPGELIEDIWAYDTENCIILYVVTDAGKIYRAVRDEDLSLFYSAASPTNTDPRFGGLVIDETGNLYTVRYSFNPFTFQSNNQLIKISPAGVLLREFAPPDEFGADTWVTDYANTELLLPSSEPGVIYCAGGSSRIDRWDIRVDAPLPVYYDGAPGTLGYRRNLYGLLENPQTHDILFGALDEGPGTPPHSFQGIFGIRPDGTEYVVDGPHLTAAWFPRGLTLAADTTKVWAWSEIGGTGDPGDPTFIKSISLDDGSIIDAFDVSLLVDSGAAVTAAFGISLLPRSPCARVARRRTSVSFVG